jgi:hypothetical protein
LFILLPATSLDRARLLDLRGEITQAISDLMACHGLSEFVTPSVPLLSLKAALASSFTISSGQLQKKSAHASLTSRLRTTRGSRRCYCYGGCSPNPRGMTSVAAFHRREARLPG